jgi:hypothetical protein
MKKILFTLGLIALLTMPAYAGGHEEHGKKIIIHKTEVTNVTNNTTNVTNENTENKNIAGAMFDAPNLVEITQDWHVGLEAYKDFLNTDSEEGYAGFIKLTYNGVLLNLSKK